VVAALDHAIARAGAILNPSPLGGQVESRPPAVNITPATIEVGHSRFQRTQPVMASIEKHQSEGSTVGSLDGRFFRRLKPTSLLKPS
jgi:hypothetical protein